jgi:hypothetical protein
MLPPFARDRLRLTEEQRRQLDELDANVRERLARILTAAQKRQLEQIHRRGPKELPGDPGRDGPPPRADREPGPEGLGPRDGGGRPPQEG